MNIARFKIPLLTLRYGGAWEDSADACGGAASFKYFSITVPIMMAPLMLSTTN